MQGASSFGTDVHLDARGIWEGIDSLRLRESRVRHRVRRFERRDYRLSRVLIVLDPQPIAKAADQVSGVGMFGRLGFPRSCRIQPADVDWQRGTTQVRTVILDANNGSAVIMLDSCSGGSVL